MDRPERRTYKLEPRAWPYPARQPVATAFGRVVVEMKFCDREVGRLLRSGDTWIAERNDGVDDELWAEALAGARQCFRDWEYGEIVELVS